MDIENKSGLLIQVAWLPAMSTASFRSFVCELPQPCLLEQAPPSLYGSVIFSKFPTFFMLMAVALRCRHFVSQTQDRQANLHPAHQEADMHP
jgi:hypothetical protein